MTDALNTAPGELNDEHVTEAIRKGVATGLAMALERPETWKAAAKGMRAAAEKEAGSLLLKWMVSALKKGVFFTVAGLVVYSIGGWSALVALWKAYTS